MLDLAALTVGYSLAALSMRAFWPYAATPGGRILAVMALAFSWLGLAMSGPFVLLLERRPRRPEESPVPTPRRRPGELPVIELAEPPRYTPAETAWLLIGGYWIAITILIVPSRVPRTALSTLSILPALAATTFWLLGRRRPRHVSRPGDGPSWTHRAALLLLATWPIAWLALILLSRTLL